MRSEINRIAQSAVNEAEDCYRAGGGKVESIGEVDGMRVAVTIEVGSVKPKAAPKPAAAKPKKSEPKEETDER